VSWDSHSQKYKAQIGVNGANRHLGLFDTAEEAARTHARAYLKQKNGGPPADRSKKERRRRLTWSLSDQRRAIQATEA